MDHALVSRYFGSKAKLFAAALSYSIEPDILTPGTPEAVSRQIATLLTDPFRPGGLHGVMVVARALSSPVVSKAERESIMASFVAPLQRALEGIDGDRVEVAVAVIIGVAFTKDLWGALDEAALSRYRSRLSKTLFLALSTEETRP